MLRGAVCGQCHIPPGRSEALKIFDLNRLDWAASMSDSQVGQIRWRVSMSDDEIKAMRGDPHNHRLSESQTRFLAEYVDKELENRTTQLQVLRFLE